MQKTYKLFRKIKYNSRSKAAIYEPLRLSKEKGSKNKKIDPSDTSKDFQKKNFSNSAVKEHTENQDEALVTLRRFVAKQRSSRAISIKDEQLKKIYGLTENAFDLPSQYRYPSWLLELKLEKPVSLVESRRDYLSERFSFCIPFGSLENIEEEKLSWGNKYLYSNLVPKGKSIDFQYDKQYLIYMHIMMLKKFQKKPIYGFLFKQNKKESLMRVFTTLRKFKILDEIRQGLKINLRNKQQGKYQALSEANYKAIFRDESYFFNNFTKRLSIFMFFLKSEVKINISRRISISRKAAIFRAQRSSDVFFESNKQIFFIGLKKIGFSKLIEEEPKIFIRRFFRSISKKPSNILFKTRIKLGMVSDSNNPSGSKKPRRRGTHSKVQLIKKIIPEIHAGRLSYTIQSYLRTNINKLLARHKILTFIMLSYWLKKLKERKSEKKYEYL